MGDRNNIATTGFSKMSDRQVAIWETGGLQNQKMITSITCAVNQYDISVLA